MITLLFSLNVLKLGRSEFTFDLLNNGPIDGDAVQTKLHKQPPHKLEVSNDRKADYVAKCWTLLGRAEGSEKDCKYICNHSTGKDNIL